MATNRPGFSGYSGTCSGQMTHPSSKKAGETSKRQPGALVVVNDRMQRGYRYRLVEPIGRNFDPEFKPELSPKEMLALGSTGYFADPFASWQRGSNDNLNGLVSQYIPKSDRFR